jgi:hypothetical protein
MSRHAMLYPILIRPASDKRKAPSLIDSPAIKKKRTSKNLLIQVRIPFLNIMPSIILIIFIFAWFQTWTQQPMVIIDSANTSSTSKIITILFFNHFYSPLFVGCRRNFGESNCGEFFSSSWFNPASPRIQPSSPQPEVIASPRNHPASPQLDIQEPSLEPEKLPSPIREARNDVSMNIHLSIFIW